MALDKTALETPFSPEWWMQTLAKRLLDRNRTVRFGTLDAYRSGCPPMVTATESQRKAYHAFNRVARSNYARTVVRAPGQKMLVRAIRTAAGDDDEGDSVAWRYWTANHLDVTATDVHTDMLTFSEGYVRVALREDGSPIAMRRDPRFCIAEPDPLNPLRTVAAFELMWDEFSGYDYAYLWLPGAQYVAERVRTSRPTQVTIPGLTAQDRRWAGMAWWPRLSFDPAGFTMRPILGNVAEEERDRRPYSQTYEVQDVPVVRFDNRDGVGEFEEHLDVLDCAFMLKMLLMVTAGVQAYKQRSLEQTASDGTDRLPNENPETGEQINWDEIFEPGPDALWKLPPGVKINESDQVDLQGLLSAIKDTLKELSITTGTPFTIFSPDGVNQSATGAEGTLQPLVDKVVDRIKIAGHGWARVVSLLFQFADDNDRYANGDQQQDRGDAGRIVIDWDPAVRYSLSEMAQADSQATSLSTAMRNQKIWGLTPDEIAINQAQLAADALSALAAQQPTAPQPAPVSSGDTAA